MDQPKGPQEGPKHGQASCYVSQELAKAAPCASITNKGTFFHVTRGHHESFRLNIFYNK